MYTQTVDTPKTLERFGTWLFLLLAFIIPIEHKYDKFLRYFSLKIIPKGLILPPGFDQKIYVYASDIIALLLFVLILVVIKTRLFVFQKGALFLWGLVFSAFISLTLSPYAFYLTPYTRLLQQVLLTR